MPKPGPRPYECVRRAWHSDRHQPMRGSLIQEIFRVVHEIHNSTTKKNKEWQEKLPIVVLKAEEIMYSKANSEAEYMDLKTLWDRADDAINTIIRLDDTTKTGVFLQPCIEAALVLGCTPRRASRSQRNNTPSNYLTPKSPDLRCVPSSNLQKTILGNHGSSDLFMPSYLNYVKPNNTSSSCLGLASQSPAVYPLYYGDRLLSNGPAVILGTPSKLNSHSRDPIELCVKRKVSSCKADNAENSHDGCDLSLRLGCLEALCTVTENSFTKEVVDVASAKNVQEGNNMSDSLQFDKKPFLQKSCLSDPLDTCPLKWPSEAEMLNVKKSMRKRKAEFDQVRENVQFSWHSKLPVNHFTGWMSNAGH